MIVELLREGRGSRPLDAAEARAALEPSRGRRGVAHERSLEAERHGTEREPPDGARGGTPTRPETEEPELLEIPVEMHHAVSRTSASVIRDHRDARIPGRRQHPADRGVEGAIHPQD